MSVISNLLKDFGTASKVSLNTAGRVTEPYRINNLRTAFSKVGPRAGLQPGRVRGGGFVIHDIINENARVRGAYASPPFSGGSRVGSSASAKARTKLAARTQELAQKKAAAGVKGRPVPGKFYPAPPKPKRVGPKTASEAKVDYLFGVD